MRAKDPPWVVVVGVWVFVIWLFSSDALEPYPRECGPQQVKQLESLVRCRNAEKCPFSLDFKVYWERDMRTTVQRCSELEVSPGYSKMDEIEDKYRLCRFKDGGCYGIR